MDQQNLVQVLLEDNLIDPVEFKENPNKFTVIECFHYNLPVHPSFEAFPTIKELRVIEQDVTDLNWLKDTPQLETLLVFHTQLRNCDGLKFAKNLVNLWLEANKLEEMPDLSALGRLEGLSIAENPITKDPLFLKMPSLKSLSLASIGIATIDASIVNLANLQNLNLSGNCFSDFDFLDVVSGLPSLTEFMMYDPRFGPNPVCSLPNYDIICCSTLQNVQILDTVKVSDRYRTVCVTKRKETDLYYKARASSDIALLDTARLNFTKESEAALKAAKRCTVIDGPEIYNTIDQFEKNQSEMEEFIRVSNELANVTGGNVAITRVEDEELESLDLKNIVVSSEAQLTSAWRIHITALIDDIQPEEKQPDGVAFVRTETIIEAVEMIQKWGHKCEPRKDLVECVDFDDSNAVIIQCNLYEDVSVPLMLFIYSVPDDVLLSRIEGCYANAVPMNMECVDSDECLVCIQNKFSLKNTLKSITLVDCGVKSLSMFEGFEYLEEISVPFNEIESLVDLPHLPSLTCVDVSYNRISRVADLIPKERAVRSVIQALNVYGNPVCTPTVLRLLPSLFKQVEPDFKCTKPIMFELDVTELNLKNIGFLDISGHCLTSLAPLNDLPNLEVLRASKNNLHAIDFKSPNLISADFSLNYITQFPSQDDFPELQTLMINGNKIRKLKPFQSLILLFVASNEIEAIPDEDMFPNLVALTISDNPLVNAPPDLRIIFQFPKLKMLNGALATPQVHSRAKSQYNGILFEERIPSLVPHGTTKLDLSGKEYRDVNALHSDTLQELMLANNNLTMLAWGTKALPRLSLLDLSNNQIQSFGFLDYLPMLRSLDLSANKLTNMTPILSTRFPRLQHLVLSNNSFKSCEVFTRENFPVLESLDLSHNFIATVPTGALDKLPSLKTLSVAYNSLRKLDNLAVPSLISLDCSHNRVTLLDEVLKITPCTQLLKFWFNDNPLAMRTSHRIRVLTMLRTLKELDGHAVTESDLNQVRIILEQNAGPALTSPQPQPIIQAVARTGATTKVNNVLLSPGLPVLQPTQPPKRQPRQPARHQW